MSNRFKFPKPVEVYKALTPFGPHIVASEHDEWKKYRKVTAPAFTEVCSSPADFLAFIIHFFRI